MQQKRLLLTLGCLGRANQYRVCRAYRVESPASIINCDGEHAVGRLLRRIRKRTDSRQREPAAVHGERKRYLLKPKETPASIPRLRR
jgi:hypothetical protein